jgi:AmmeMemoRadiSam system protein B/AmmeMemoRadiSam system protein A
MGVKLLRCRVVDSMLRLLKSSSVVILSEAPKGPSEGSNEERFFGWPMASLRMTVLFIAWCVMGIASSCFAAGDVKKPNVAGAFYPADPVELSLTVDAFLAKATPGPMPGQIFGLISPHAGYNYSGQVAAFGYELIKDKPYKTVIILAPSHRFAFYGASVYLEGAFRTPLGDIEVDKDFTRKIIGVDKDIFYESRAFAEEHSLETQLPFLQRSLSGFKIVPIIIGDCGLAVCNKLVELLSQAIGPRKDVLVVASSDMYHGYDYDEANVIDQLTLGYLKKMDAEGLYNGVRQQKLQMCGVLPAVTLLMLAQDLGHKRLDVLKYTNSAEVSGNRTKGIWTVGYSSCAIDGSALLTINPERLVVSVAEPGRGVDNPKGEKPMLTKEQRKELLDIARDTIKHYLLTGKKLEVKPSDPVLSGINGAFVTLHLKHQLKGCIGNIIGRQPLYLTIRDMAIESATGDPRFTPVKLGDLKDILIEISVLSPLELVDSADKIILGTHGVLVKRGFSNGVFLPQVATETGWSKDYFLSELCSQKAGLAPDAWKEKGTELYVFTAEVFSESEY